MSSPESFGPRCLNPECASVLGNSPFSENHARYLNSPEFSVDLRWCRSCGKISLREKSRLYNRLKAWQYPSLIYGLFPFRETWFGNYDDLIGYLLAKSKKHPGPTGEFVELLWHIRYCLAASLGFDVEDESSFDEELIWEEAKASFSPLQLVKYATTVQSIIGAKTLSNWIREAEILWEGRCHPRIIEMMKELRQRIDSTLNQ